MWPDHLQVAQVRIARPTDKFEEIKYFYGTILGLSEIGNFNNHDGFDGIMYGLPTANYHLEFVCHKDGSPCPAPSDDNLLVFYFDGKHKAQGLLDRFEKYKINSVEPVNPYWENISKTFEDPDGWRIVIVFNKFR